MPAASPTLSRLKASTDARHLMRYLKSKANIPIAEIAKQEHVSLKTVQDSIREMERYESKNSAGQLSLAVNDLIISTMPIAKETMLRLLNATNTVERKNNKTGLMDIVGEPDKVTQLEAMRIVKGLIETTQPKGPMIQQNISQTNQTAVLSNAETTEERFKRLRQKAAEHNLLAPVVTGTPAVIDAGYDPDEDDGKDDEDD